MKVLHVSNFYYNRGGDCTHLLSLMKLLERKGHRNILFSMHHPQNFASDYSRYFTSYINYAEEVKNKNIYNAFKVLYRTIYSVEARKKIESLINDEKPDIAHLQNIHHHITPSVFYVLKRYNIPIVWTLHDYSLICPNTHFLCNGQICEKCRKNKFYWAVINRCKKNSLSASFVAMTETIIHRAMKINDMVDIFITPSNFLRDKLIEYGLNRDKIICLNNFIDLDRFSPAEETNNDNYYLYVGRLEEIKGVRTLVDAAIKADAGKLKIAGDGILREELISHVKSRNKNKMIEFLGHKDHGEVIKLMKKCRFVVLPSEWYENFPYSILEAFACGKPVIGARIGGIPELVKDKETGITFKSGNVDDLTLKIKYLVNNPHESFSLGQNAKDIVYRKLNAEEHYQALIKIYQCFV